MIGLGSQRSHAIDAVVKERAGEPRRDLYAHAADSEPGVMHER